jgi:hypothetical protein
VTSCFDGGFPLNKTIMSAPLLKPSVLVTNETFSAPSRFIL